VLALKSMMI
jgi:hypothetical protein